MKPIYKSLLIEAEVLSVSLSLRAQVTSDETVTTQDIQAESLEGLKVVLISQNVSGAKDLIASGECVLDGANININLQNLAQGIHRVQVSAVFGTQTCVIYALDLTVPAGALSDTPQEFEDEVIVVSTFGDGQGENDLKSAVSVTHAQLVVLRNSGKLVAGQTYRITDYVTTTDAENTQSAGHAFDLIVTALSENVLSEEASAIRHEGDTYFADCNLAAWKVMYCLDNDTDRFAWADEENGKGVIYRLIDEHNNDCPYDFKNIQFKRWAITDISSTSLTADALSSLKEALVYADNGNRHMANKDIYGNWIPQDIQGTKYTIDEDNFGWYYTFDGISSEDGETPGAHYDMSAHPFRLSDECIQAQLDDGCGVDYADYCKNNIIKSAYYEYVVDDQYYKGRQVLNNIVFANSMSYCYCDEDGKSWNYTTNYCYANVFESECTYNTFGNNFQYNTFGNSCGSNTFGNNCHRNTFGNYCNNNTFGNDCGSNTFGNDCYNNTFGNNCYNNTFENDCYNNTFGNNFQYNTFGNGCESNTFGNGCESNTFGNSCGSNTFGNNFQYNTFGNGCGNNTFGNNCYRNTFENSCYNNTFGNNCGANTFGEGARNDALTKDFMRYVTLESGVQYVDITCADTTSGSTYGQNILVHSGVIGTNDARKTCSIDDAGNDFLTEFGVVQQGVVS